MIEQRMTRTLQDDSLLCPVSRCPVELRNNSVCEARCNLEICNFDFGDCLIDDLPVDDYEDDYYEDGILATAFSTNLITTVLVFGGVTVFFSFCRGFCFSFNHHFNMTPWDRLLILLCIKSREEVEREMRDTQRADGNVEVVVYDSTNDANETEGVRIATTVSMAVEVADQEPQRQAGRNEQDLGEEGDATRDGDEEEGDATGDGDEEEGEVPLPVANRASIASGALPTAVEFSLDSLELEEEAATAVQPQQSPEGQ